MKVTRRIIVIFITGLVLGAGLVFFNLTHGLMPYMSHPLRHTKLPLFDPHRKNFTCVYQSQNIPPSDSQAEIWYQQALSLDDPNIWYEKRDWVRIYQLYQQAAERNHWKAMLNLASLILSTYPVPEHDPEAAIRLVEKAMDLGVADAWDRMGVYHQNGLIKGGNATSAYAFFQKAADMGSPEALTFLGKKMDGAYDDPEGDFWGNTPIATKMLECAFAQGDGDAALELGFIYARPKTSDAKARALRILHEGVKLGSAQCASALFTEFDGMDLSDGSNLVGYVDKARAARYIKVSDALEFWQGRLKLPNLDKVLPLPPSPLPKWDGNAQTLIDAAKAVSLPPKPQARTVDQTETKSAAPEAPHSNPMIAAGRIREAPPLLTATSCDGARVCPITGVWEGRVPSDHPLAAVYNVWYQQAFVEKGAAFPRSRDRFLDIAPEQIRWAYLGTPNEETDAPGGMRIAL